MHVQVKQLIQTRLNLPARQQLKHALYRLATSDVLSKDCEWPAKGQKQTMTGNQLPKFAIITLLYNRYSPQGPPSQQ